MGMNIMLFDASNLQSVFLILLFVHLVYSEGRQNAIILHWMARFESSWRRIRIAIVRRIARRRRNVQAGDDDDLCPICADTLSSSSPTVGLSCCGQSLCQSCLFRHVMAVFEEGISNSGRSKLLCPVGCGQELSDGAIRKCLHRQYPQSLLTSVCATSIMKLLQLLGFFRNQDPFRSSRFYEAWWHLYHSTSERRALLRYEQWSLAVAMRDRDDDSLVVLSCPAPDCGYMWLGNQSYRRSKQDHEQRGVYLWYSPPKPEQHYDNWAQAEYINMAGYSRGDFPPTIETMDGRKMCCAKCHCQFCGLCRRPWSMRVGRRSWRSANIKSHHSISCDSYAGSLPSSLDDSYAFVGQLQNTRSCPRCSLRTSRIDGCNHMTCPCGKEWCYVCECSWSVGHYACVERRQRDGAAGSGCVVS